MDIKYSGFISLAGAPNVGKSTLLNALVGQKVAIVSPRPQTTRNRIVGIRNDDGHQLVFIDTPGLHAPRNALGDLMMKTADENIGDADIVALVTVMRDAPSKIERTVIDNIKARKQKSVLVINKVDLIKDKTLIMKVIEGFSALHEFDAVVPLCAKTGRGVEILLDEFKKLLPEGVQYYPDDMYTETPERVYAAEIVREKLLRSLSDEVPHGLAVDVEQYARRDNGIYDITVTIICERAGHKGIIIGSGGEKLKAVASSARRELEEHLNARVNLQCWVKVKADWRNNRSALRSYGFE